MPHSTGEEIDQAVAAAREAFPAWADTPPPDRAQALFRLKALMEEHFEELSLLVTRENGKTLPEARGEVRRGIEVVELACGAPTLLMGTSLDQIAGGIDEEAIRFPVGVVAGITPFNFPNMVPLWMIPLALACGNTFILKPSQQHAAVGGSPGRADHEAGFPDGVFNVVHGAKDSVDALLRRTRGSTRCRSSARARVAAYIYATAAAHGKRVQALGGAKNHHAGDGRRRPASRRSRADLGSAFGNAGQRCLAGSVAVGVGEAGDAVREVGRPGRAPAAGPGAEPDADMGPVINGSGAGADRLRRRRPSAGARLVADGREAGRRPAASSWARPCSTASRPT